MATNRPPKILHVATIAGTLGLFISPITRQLREHGFEVDAAAAGIQNNQRCLDAFNRCHDVPFSRSFRSTANITSARRAIQRIATENEYDLIHVHTPIASFVTRYALRNRPKSCKIVYTAHGFHFIKGAPWLQNKAFSTLEKIAAKWMDHLIVINQQDYENAKKLNIANESNMTFMSGIGIDLDKFRPPANRTEVRTTKRNELGLSPDSHIFLLVAGFTANKRHVDAVRALAMLPKNRRFDLLLAGVGEKLAATKKLASDLGVVDQVHFLGYRRDIVELLVASDVMLLISKREGLPRSIMEALAINTKIIGTDIRGTADLIRHDIGILVPPCDPASLSQAMSRSTNFEPARDQVQKLLESCSLPTIVDQHIELYSKLLGDRVSTEPACVNAVVK